MYVCVHVGVNVHVYAYANNGVKVVGYFVYYRFINPALVSPDAYGLLDAPLTPAQAKNVIVLAKVLQVIIIILIERHISHKSNIHTRPRTRTHAHTNTHKHPRMLLYVSGS